MEQHQVMSSDISPEIKETLLDTVVGAASGAVTGAAELVVNEFTSDAPIDGVVEGVLENAAIGAAAGLAKNVIKGAAKAAVTRSMKKAIEDRFHNAVCTINDTVHRVTENFPSPPELATLMYYQMTPETHPAPNDPIWDDNSKQEFLRKCSVDKGEDPSFEDPAAMMNDMTLEEYQDLQTEGYCGCRISTEMSLLTFYHSALPIEYEETDGDEIETDYIIEEDARMMDQAQLLRQLLTVLYHVDKRINHEIHYHNVVVMIEQLIEQYGAGLVGSKHLDVNVGSFELRISSCPVNHFFGSNIEEAGLRNLNESYEDVFPVPRVVKLVISLMDLLKKEVNTQGKFKYYVKLINLVEELVLQHRSFFFKAGRKAYLYIQFNTTLLRVQLCEKISRLLKTVRDLVEFPKLNNTCCIYRFSCLLCRENNTDFMYINYSSNFCVRSNEVQCSNQSRHMKHCKPRSKPAEILANHAREHLKGYDYDVDTIFGVSILRDFREFKYGLNSRVRKSLVEFYRWLYSCSSH